MRKFVTAAVVLLVAPAMPTKAQTAGEPLARKMTECSAIARDADRLACYDDAVAGISPEARAAAERRAKESARIAAEEAAVAAAAAKAKAEADAVAAAEARRNAFGAEAITTRGTKRFEPAPDEIRTIESAVSETFKNAEGFSVFLLENGQLWREVDIPQPLNARVGDKVVVERTPLGGYKLNFTRLKRVILVKRLK
jgi:hypothetical protein